ncbi:hypothetical protein GCM10020258_38150 [Sphingomonas yabuuchiae]
MRKAARSVHLGDIGAHAQLADFAQERGQGGGVELVEAGTEMRLQTDRMNRNPRPAQFAQQVEHHGATGVVIGARLFQMRFVDDQNRLGIGAMRALEGLAHMILAEQAIEGRRTPLRRVIVHHLVDHIPGIGAPGEMADGRIDMPVHRRPQLVRAGDRIDPGGDAIPDQRMAIEARTDLAREVGDLVCIVELDHAGLFLGARPFQRIAWCQRRAMTLEQAAHGRILQILWIDRGAEADAPPKRAQGYVIGRRCPQAECHGGGTAPANMPRRVQPAITARPRCG